MSFTGGALVLGLINLSPSACEQQLSFSIYGGCKNKLVLNEKCFDIYFG